MVSGSQAFSGIQLVKLSVEFSGGQASSGHAEFFGNELADWLAKTGATLSFADVPSPLAQVVSKIRHTTLPGNVIM